MSEQVITVTGLREVQKKLYAYSQGLGDRVVRGALRQGASYVLRGVKDLLPVKTGLLKRRGFRVANSRIHAGKLSTDMIGIYISLRKKKGDPFYGRFLNDGWVPNPGKAAKGGEARRAAARSERQSRGIKKVPGKEYVSRGFESRKNAAVDLIVRSAEAGADVLARKVGL